MNTNDLTLLDRMADDLSGIAERLRDQDDGRSTNPVAQIRKCSYILQDAIEELMAEAAKSELVKKHFGRIELVPGL